ncbi:MAG: phosphate ABC transporter permease subunit PstC [Alphaproteobacteria bacterium]|nr:phosphate ABC transporter permease subunit PstC [Alphaproteobacteria bacterium]
MQTLILTIVLLALTAAGFRLGRGRALALVGGRPKDLSALPRYYGVYVALWVFVPAAVVFAVWFALEPAALHFLVIGGLPPELQALPQAELGLLYSDIRNAVALGVTPDDPAIASAVAHYRSLSASAPLGLGALALAATLAGGGIGLKLVRPQLRARRSVESVVRMLLLASSTIAVFTTIGIVLSLLFEALRFFRLVPVTEFLFGHEWSPQTAIRADQVGSSGAFGAGPVFAGTALISVIAMTVAAPVGLLSAIYMAEYAPKPVRAVLKPLLEILAGIPTVVYGFFAALTVAPFVRNLGGGLGLDVASESALAAGAVMGIMIIPFVSSLSDDAIAAVPNSLREGAYGLGATRSETIRQVILPAALPGIVGGLLLGVSRAIGETMIVVMAAGLAANLTANPFEAVTTVTVQIVTLLTGDQEFDSAKTLAAFALGLMLFLVTLVLNVIALYVVRRYREHYE